jgi:hypothetical protein
MSNRDTREHEINLRTLDLSAFTDAEAAALTKILKAKRPWVAVGVDAEAMTALAAQGLVVLWERTKRGTLVRGGPLCSLTPLGAHRLGAILVEKFEGLVVWRLATKDKHGSPIRREGTIKPDPRQWAKRKDPDLLEILEDPRPGPLEQAIENERFLMREKLTAEGRPDLDPVTGKKVMEEVKLFGLPIPITQNLRGKRSIPVGVKRGRKAKVT